MGPDEPADPVGVLRRWEDAGAVWQVVERSAGSATVSLRTCDGGEEVDRFRSADARLLDFLARRAWGPADRGVPDR